MNKLVHSNIYKGTKTLIAGSSLAASSVNMTIKDLVDRCRCSMVDVTQRNPDLVV